MKIWLFVGGNEEYVRNSVKLHNPLYATFILYWKPVNSRFSISNRYRLLLRGINYLPVHNFNG